MTCFNITTMLDTDFAMPANLVVRLTIHPLLCYAEGRKPEEEWDCGCYLDLSSDMMMHIIIMVCLTWPKRKNGKWKVEWNFLEFVFAAVVPTTVLWRRRTSEVSWFDHHITWQDESGLQLFSFCACPSLHCCSSPSTCSLFLFLTSVPYSMLTDIHRCLHLKHNLTLWLCMFVCVPCLDPQLISSFCLSWRKFVQVLGPPRQCILIIILTWLAGGKS